MKFHLIALVVLSFSAHAQAAVLKMVTVPAKKVVVTFDERSATEDVEPVQVKVRLKQTLMAQSCRDVRFSGRFYNVEKNKYMAVAEFGLAMYEGSCGDEVAREITIYSEPAVLTMYPYSALGNIVMIPADAELEILP